MKLQQITLLIASILLIESSAVLGTQRGCPPSSCGDPYVEIRYPFRLKVDPAGCGDPRYELTCDGNTTILDFHPGQYDVVSISYNVGYEYILLDGSAGGACPHPSQFLSGDTITRDGRFTLEKEYTPVSFVNCSQKIESVNYNYTPIPCLSGSYAFVYMSLNTTVGSLAPYCRFLAMLPIRGTWGDLREVDIFRELQSQSLTWVRGRCGLVLDTITKCLGQTYSYAFQEDLTIFNHSDQFIIFYAIIIRPLTFQKRFFNCLHPAPNCLSNYIIFSIVKVVVVLVDAVVFIGVARLLCKLLLIALAVVALIAYKFHETRVPIDEVENFLLHHQSLTPTRYGYIDLVVMTKHFKEKLGQGGFGSVYKGELPGGLKVAVKMLGSSKCNGDDFISEVSTIGKIHHVNIVRLVGFCSDGSKRALVYEYLPMGSLDKYIFSSGAAIQRPFTWDTLNNIALGVARGIDYLHRGCDMRILHFDIKPHNILLDDYFNPKVSDFGLARLFPKDFSMVALSAARGTIGYIAPEQVSRSFGIISYKSDVYSYGMLLLEMAGGRRNVEPKVENTSQIYYPSWIFDQLDAHRDFELDSIVKDFTKIGEVEKKLSIVGLWCIQTRPTHRPSMSRVIEMLQADIDTLEIPPKPFSGETISSVPIQDHSSDHSSIGMSYISEHASSCESLSHTCTEDPYLEPAGV